MASFGQLSNRTKEQRPTAVARPAKGANADPNEEKTRTVISEEITLYTTKVKEPLAFMYELMSTAPKVVRFTMNFNGSVNFAAVDGTGKAVANLSLTGMIPPNGKAALGNVSLADASKGARLEVEYDWEFVEPDPVKVKAAVEQNAKAIEAMIKQGGAKEGAFVDPNFPPVKASLYTVNPTIIASGEESGLAPEGEQVAWYRPSEFYQVSFHCPRSRPSFSRRLTS